MPIPMRTPSLREPRKQSSLHTGRTTTTTLKTTSAVPPTAASASNPTTTTGTNENASRNKLLPVRDDVRSASASRLQQPQESRLPQRGLRPSSLKLPGHGQQEPAAPSGSTVARRQSLIRPSLLKTTSAAKSTTTTTTTTTTTPRGGGGPPSPVKSTVPSKENRRPTSPKKTDMPPPPRPARSASLRQPVRSTPGIPLSTPRGHTRHRSQVVPPASTSTSTSMKKTEPPSPVTTTPRTRGQFSTYQEHYSPKKMGPSATTAPSGPPAALDPSLIPSSWPEIAALQTELLQLSLLHSSSQQQHAAWQSDAESGLRRLYESVASDYRGVMAEECAYQRQRNGQALQGWVDNCREHQGQGFAEQIQVLSQVTQELCDLTDSPSGRYLSLVQGFESWFHQAEEIRSYRRLYPHETEGAVFIDSLDASWKQEVYTMTMTLELCLRQLQSLDILGYGTVEPLEGSTLLRTATGLTEMGTMMVEELQTMRKIEADIIATERQWVSQLAGQLATATATRPGNPVRARVGMWSALSVKS